MTRTIDVLNDEEKVIKDRIRKYGPAADSLGVKVQAMRQSVEVSKRQLRDLSEEANAAQRELNELKLKTELAQGELSRAVNHDPDLAEVARKVLAPKGVGVELWYVVGSNMYYVRMMVNAQSKLIYSSARRDVCCRLAGQIHALLRLKGSCPYKTCDRKQDIGVTHPTPERRGQ